MNLFTASNGVVLDEHGDEYDTQLRHRKGDTHEARKEFYQHLRDKELGQTREGNIIVRPISDEEVLVWDETTGESERWWRDQIPLYPRLFGNEEAKRYFEARSEPEPWHDAEPGEIWVLEFGGDKRAYNRTATLFTNWDTSSLLPTDAGIKSGYRIWPEGDSDG